MSRFAIYLYSPRQVASSIDLIHESCLVPGLCSNFRITDQPKKIGKCSRLPSMYKHAAGIWSHLFFFSFTAKRQQTQANQANPHSPSKSFFCKLELSCQNSQLIPHFLWGCHYANFLSEANRRLDLYCRPCWAWNCSAFSKKKRLLSVKESPIEATVTAKHNDRSVTMAKTSSEQLRFQCCNKQVPHACCYKVTLKRLPSYQWSETPACRFWVSSIAPALQKGPCQCRPCLLRRCCMAAMRLFASHLELIRWEQWAAIPS